MSSRAGLITASAGHHSADHSRTVAPPHGSTGNLRPRAVAPPLSRRASGAFSGGHACGQRRHGARLGPAADSGQPAPAAQLTADSRAATLQQQQLSRSPGCCTAAGQHRTQSPQTATVPAPSRRRHHRAEHTGPPFYGSEPVLSAARHCGAADDECSSSMGTERPIGQESRPAADHLRPPGSPAPPSRHRAAGKTPLWRVGH